MRRARLLCLVAVLGCKPELGAPLSTLTEPRVIGVRVTPPEAAPGARVVLEALVAGPEGPVPATVDWAFCSEGKPLTENDVVASACLIGPGSPIAITSEPVEATMPLDACKRFGPELPPSTPGQSPLRPRDPDVTGGYYQPVRLRVDGASAIALPRVQCSLPNAPIDVALDHKQRYRANQSPAVVGLDLLADGAIVDPAAVPARRAVRVRVTWTPESEERFVVHDLAARALVERREALRVSWFASAGALSDEHTGADAGAASENTWRTPAAGPAHLWAVVRDDRGGLDVKHVAVTIVE